jgi:hypothetical protein
MKMTLMKHADLVLLLLKAADGIERHFPTSALLNGKRVSSKRLTALLRGHVRKREQAAAAHAAWLKMTRDLRTELRGDIIPTMFALRTIAQSTYGLGSEPYTDLGFHHRPRRRASVVTRVLGMVRGAATRKARGTMGKKQRAKIHGVVDTEPTR